MEKSYIVLKIFTYLYIKLFILWRWDEYLRHKVKYTFLGKFVEFRYKYKLQIISMSNLEN